MFETEHHAAYPIEVVSDAPFEKIVRILLETGTPFEFTLTSIALIDATLLLVEPSIYAMEPPFGDHVGDDNISEVVEAVRMSVWCEASESITAI